MTSLTSAPTSYDLQVDLDFLLRHTQHMINHDAGLTDESPLIAGTSYVFPPIPGSGYSFALPDLVLDKNVTWRLIECNVTNGAGTSSFAADLPRAAHEADTILAFGSLRDDEVILRAMSPDTRSTTEIKLRSVLLAAQLRGLTGGEVQVLSSSESIAPGPAVVTGSIPDLLRYIQRDADGLTFRGRRVRCVLNPNLITAIALRERCDLKQLLLDLPEGILAEGTLMATLGLDKVLQQDLVPAPLIRPVRSFRTDGFDETVNAALNVAKDDGGAVIKPLNASGGVSVLFVNADDTTETLMAAMHPAAEAMEAKYGKNYLANSPWTVSTFVESLPARSPSATLHRWDARFQVEITPYWVRVTPLSARLCPEPIGKRLTEASAKCNQTGRSTHKSIALDPSQLIEATGMAPDAFEEAARGLYQYFTALFT